MRVLIVAIILSVSGASAALAGETPAPFRAQVSPSRSIEVALVRTGLARVSYACDGLKGGFDIAIRPGGWVAEYAWLFTAVDGDCGGWLKFDLGFRDPDDASSPGYLRRVVLDRGTVIDWTPELDKRFPETRIQPRRAAGT